MLSDHILPENKYIFLWFCCHAPHGLLMDKDTVVWVKGEDVQLCHYKKGTSSKKRSKGSLQMNVERGNCITGVIDA